jgi:hypothetical protein
MQNKQSNSVYNTLLPKVPEDYRSRMEDVLAALPVDSATRSVSFPRFGKKKLILLIAALVTLLSVGTAFAIGVSRMQEVRDVGLEKVNAISDFVNDTDHPDATQPDNTLGSSGSVPIAVGTRDENGRWQPWSLQELNESVQVGSFTVRLDSIHYYGRATNPVEVLCYVESETTVSYQLAPCTLSIDGAEPVPESDGDLRAKRSDANRSSSASNANGQSDLLLLSFETENKNPFRPGATFTLSSELNGQPFTLTYKLTKERFENFRQNMLNDIEHYATELRSIPEDTIPLDIVCNSSRILDIAVKDHWLYYTYEPDKAYWEGRETGKDPLPYGSFDGGGLYTVVDGMYCPDEFISSKRTGEDMRDFIELARVYLPYGKTLPAVSLVSISGASFRIEWATGKVTLPKDETEWLAWRQECEANFNYYADYDANYVAKPNAQADTFTVTDLMYNNRMGLKGMIGLVLETETPVKKPHNGKDNQPVVTINGTTLEGMTVEYGLTDRYEGGSENGGKRVGFLLYGPAYRTLPDSFEVTIAWNGSSTTFTMHKSDLIRMYVGDSGPEMFHNDYAAALGL